MILDSHVAMNSDRIGKLRVVWQTIVSATGQVFQNKVASPQARGRSGVVPLWGHRWPTCAGSRDVEHGSRACHAMNTARLTIERVTLRLVTLKQVHHGQPRLRYRATPCIRSGDRAWAVYDGIAWRLVAITLHQHEACTLAHTLNVADLCVPPVNFGEPVRPLLRRR